MSRLSDPTVCPDCRGQVSPDAVCTACGLTLTGPLATQLWRAMLTADDLVERLRRQPGTAAAPQAPGRVAVPAPATLPAFPSRTPSAASSTGAGPMQPAPPARSGLSGRAVPVILLGLGGIFVFVAVSLFLAVTWEVLPLSVKAALMLGFTAAVGGVAAHLSRKGLRGSAEALWALVAGLLMLDLRAGYVSGLLGLDELSSQSVLTLAGALLFGLGVGVALGAQRTRIARCVAAECTLVAGVLLVTAMQGWNTMGTGLREAIAVPVLAGVGLLLRDRLRDASYAVAGLGVLTWVLLAAHGVNSGLAAQTRADFWAGFDGWPLLVATVYAALVASVRTLAPEVRGIAAGSTLVGLSLLVLLPAEWSTREVLLLAAVVLALAAVVRFTPRPWSAAASVLGGAVAAGAALGTVLLPAGLTLAFVVDHEAWSTRAGTLFPTFRNPSPWTLIALVLACLALAAAAARRDVRRRRMVLPVGAVVLTLAAAAGVAGAGQPLWVVVAALATVTVVAVVAALVRSGESQLVCLVLGAETLALSLAVASRSDVVLAVLASLLVVVAVAATALRREAAPAVVLLVALAVDSWAHVADAGVLTRSDLLTAVSCLFLLATSYVIRIELGRVLAELAAGLVAVVALVLAVEHAAHFAGTLTVVGTAIALLAVLRHDRVHLGWAGSAVLTVGTLVRLDLPRTIGAEVYTLPAAALLIAAGVHRLLREPRTGTWTVLGSGLTLALVPSLLISLPDPTSLRAFLVGTGGAIALVVGMERRWQAPFLTGAAVLGVLALRFLLPLAQDILANPLGAWMLFGSLGAACLAAGVLWEQSLRNLRLASRYVGNLR
jgi:hypothetical protein